MCKCRLDWIEIMDSNGTDSLIRKIHRWLRRSPPNGPISFVKHFPYKDIKKARDGFCRTVYSNSRGSAYKTKLQEGEFALVKEAKEFDQKKDVFYREVQLLSRLHHRHILALKGFSMGHKSLLVFENIESGSLKDHLNDPLRTPLNWRTRLHIAVGVAAALEYLLFFSDPPVCYVSINSSNIMLDDNFTAKLLDIAFFDSLVEEKKIMPQDTHAQDHRDAKDNNIVFQIGILILELFTGQSSDNGGDDLIQWVKQGRRTPSMQNMIDPDLGNDYNSKELKELLAVAKICITSRDQPADISVAKLCRYLQKKHETPLL